MSHRHLQLDVSKAQLLILLSKPASFTLSFSCFGPRPWAHPWFLPLLHFTSNQSGNTIVSYLPTIIYRRDSKHFLSPLPWVIEITSSLISLPLNLPPWSLYPIQQQKGSLKKTSQDTSVLCSKPSSGCPTKPSLIRLLATLLGSPLSVLPIAYSAPATLVSLFLSTRACSYIRVLALKVLSAGGPFSLEST